MGAKSSSRTSALEHFSARHMQLAPELEAQKALVLWGWWGGSTELHSRLPAVLLKRCVGVSKRMVQGGRARSIANVFPCCGPCCQLPSQGKGSWTVAN